MMCCTRENGPAMVLATGIKRWYYQGNIHREDGPAIEYPSGQKEWFLQGNQITEKEFDCYFLTKNLPQNNSHVKNKPKI